MREELMTQAMPVASMEMPVELPVPVAAVEMPVEVPELIPQIRRALLSRIQYAALTENQQALPLEMQRALSTGMERRQAESEIILQALSTDILSRQAEFVKSLTDLPPKNRELAISMRAGIEADYILQAPQICQKTGLDVVAHRSLIQQLMTAEKRMTICNSCDGRSCLQAGDMYKQPKVEISERTLTGGKFEWLPCQKREQIRIAKLAEESGLPKIFRNWSWKDYPRTEENRVLLEEQVPWFLKTPDVSLYVHGVYGSAKTLLATLIGKEFLRRGKDVKFCTVSMMLTEIKETFDKKELSMADILRKYTKCDLLIMDDLARTEPTAWQVDRIQDLLDARYTEGKSVLITSNYSWDELKSRLKCSPGTAGAIVSRLYDMCEVGYSGSVDFRKRKKKQWWNKQ